MIVHQVVGYKNAGKTTLVCELVRELAARGFKVGTIKRDAHDTDPEPEGKDTRRHREAGAAAAALSTPNRTGWVVEEPIPLDGLVAAMRDRGIDIVLIEGFKRAPYPKTALLRRAADADLLELAKLRCIVVRERETGLQSRAAASASDIPVLFAPDLLADRAAVRRIADFIADQEPVER